MSIFSVFRTVVKTVGNVATVVVNVGRQLLPFIGAARQAIPAVDEAVTKVEDVIAQGGAEADQFLDRNIDTIRDLDGFFVELQEVGVRGQAVTGYAIQASQVDSPTTVTPEEAEELARRIWALKESLAAIASKNDLEAKLAALA